MHCQGQLPAQRVSSGLQRVCGPIRVVGELADASGFKLRGHLESACVRGVCVCKPSAALSLLALRELGKLQLSVSYIRFLFSSK